MCFAEARQGDEGLWVGSLIPIPMMWAPLFLDYQNMGTTYRQVEDLVQGSGPPSTAPIQAPAYECGICMSPARRVTGFRPLDGLEARRKVATHAPNLDKIVVGGRGR
jgi:hypothetical protein